MLTFRRFERARPAFHLRLVSVLSFGLLLLLSNTSIVSAETSKDKEEHISAQGSRHFNIFGWCRSTFELKNDNSIMAFNKYNYTGKIDGNVHVLRFPDEDDKKLDYCKQHVIKLEPDDFPITQNRTVVDCLELSNAISVRTENDYAIRHCISDLMNAVNAEPVFPEASADAPFWDELHEVVAMRKLESSLPAAGEVKMELPDRWKDFTLGEMANAVYDEPPCYWQGYVIRDILSGKYGPVTVDDRVMKWRGTSVEFIDGVIALSEICTWAVLHVSNHNFAAKYLAGMPRPEEVVHAITTGDISKDHVPNDLYNNIMAFNLEHAVDFTAYPDGAPRHPSYPAMHSAASNLSLWLPVVLKATPEQICAIKKIDYAVSYARTVAGVHYPQDNRIGLKLGQEIMKRALPYYLKKNFRGDADYIRHKVEMVSFDWNNIDPANICA